MTTDHPFLNQAKRDMERAEIARSKAEVMLLAAEKDLVRLRGFIEQYEYYLHELDKTQSTIRNRLTTRNLTDVAVSIIEASDGPTSIQSILNKLNSLGIEVGGENKSANLAAYLSKDSRVRYERGYGWMISSEALFENTPPISAETTSNRTFDPNSVPPNFGEVRKRYRASSDTATLVRPSRPDPDQTYDDEKPF
jgi:hypothetical protein